MKREQLRVTPIDPPGESAVLDGYVQFSLMTEDQVRYEYGYGQQWTGADGQFTVTFQIPAVPGSSWFPYEDPRWWFVAATWRAQNEQLAIESRAGQQRRLWREYMQENWPPIEFRRWLPEDPDPTRWEIHVGD